MVDKKKEIKTIDMEETCVNKKTKQKDKVMILGFAPDSLRVAPIADPTFDIWGLNELYLEYPQIANNASLWFQLHGYEPPTVRDPHQVKNLGVLKCPVMMWRNHPHIPNSERYPLEEILNFFDVFGEGLATDQPDLRNRAYFTNTISWMIALAIYKGYKEIHVFGVNMAQDQEYQHQRPSCEFFLGWARGMGIKIYLPPVSDLMKSTLLYGFDDGSSFMQKMDARSKELNNRLDHIRNQKNQLQNQMNQLFQAENQIVGAIEDNKYMIKIGPQGINPQLPPLKEDIKHVKVDE
jgi:hypothetical protein